jgi:hypothetical protein
MTSRRNPPLAAFLLAALSIATAPAHGQEQATRQISVPTQKVIFDTDIGDDIDDVFALGLLLNSPELNLLGLTSAWGDTELRAPVTALSTRNGTWQHSGEHRSQDDPGS